MDGRRSKNSSVKRAPLQGLSSATTEGSAMRSFALTRLGSKATLTRMLDLDASLSAARGGDAQAFRDLVAPHERELRAYCYRMAGSLDDADDLLQESLVRAWRGLPGFEGRSSLRTWLYRVAWSACVDALATKPARMLTVDVGPPHEPSDPVPPPP